MLLRLSTFVVFGLVVFLGGIPQPSEASPCSRLQDMMVSDSDNSQEQKGERWLHRLLRAFWYDESQQAQSAEDPELYFTSSSGFSVRPVCEGKFTHRAHLYYPIGLVVKKLSEENLKASKRYALVEAEHGLRMYIKLKHLQPVLKDKTYFFANGLVHKPYCQSPTECSENDQLTQAKEGQVLHPTRRYAVAETNSDNCQSTEVKLYNRGHKILTRRDGSPSPAFITPCVLDLVLNEETGRYVNRGLDGNVKIVQRKYYDELFRVPIRGNYQLLSQSIMDRLLPKNTNVKFCKERSIEELNTRGAAGAGAELNIYVFSGSAEFEVERIKKRIRELGDGIYIFYSSYFVEQAEDSDTAGAPTDNVAQIRSHPIESIFKCDKSEGGLLPETLYVVHIHNADLDSGEFSIYAKKIVELLKKQKPLGEEYEDLAGLQLASLDGKKLGQYWRVTGYFEYFRLRDALQSHIVDNTKVSDLVDFDAEPHVYQRHIDYFTHLAMVSMTEFRPKR